MYFDETYGESAKSDHNWVGNDVTKLDESGGRNRGRVEKNWRDRKNRDGAEKLEGHFCTRMTTICDSIESHLPNLSLHLPVLLLRAAALHCCTATAYKGNSYVL